ncbi:MAG: hypothetical protein ACKVTZ_17635 [Bacteroidia bacterium]
MRTYISYFLFCYICLNVAMAQQYYLQSSLVANTQRSDRFRVISGTQSISDNFNDQQVQDYLQFSPALGYVFENQNLLEIAFLGGYHTESYLNEDATAMLPITGFKAHRPHFSTIVS